MCNLVCREVIIYDLVGLQSCTPCCHFGLCPLIITKRCFQGLVFQPTSLPWNARSSNCLPGSTVNWRLLLHLLCLWTLLINISTLLTPCHFSVGYIHEIVTSQSSRRSGRFSIPMLLLSHHSHIGSCTLFCKSCHLPGFHLDSEAQIFT